MKFLIYTFATFSSLIGTAVIFLLMAMALSLSGDAATLFSLISTVVSWVIGFLTLQEDCDSGYEDAAEIFFELVEKVQVRVKCQSRECRVIRGNIAEFLSDKNPSGLGCPYCFSKETLLSKAVREIWEEECRKRSDRIILSTNL